MATDKASSEYPTFALRMLNLWIGLTRGVAGLPSLLKDLKYQAEHIELQFRNTSGDTIHPELILSSVPKSHSLLLECKSGANTEPDQLRRYAGITADDLRQRAYLSSKAWARHDVIVIGLPEHCDRLGIGIDTGGYRFPLLSVHSDGIALLKNEFALPELTDGFRPKLQFDTTKAPLSFVPFERHSPDWVIADRVIPHLITLMHQRQPRIFAENIASAILPTWTIMSTTARRDVVVAIERVLEKASENEFEKHLKRKGKNAQGQRAWEIVDNPLDLSSDKRSAAFKRLLKAHRDFLEYLKDGKRRPRQMSLPDGEEPVD